jgi:peptide/nickel transport system permease protein
MVIASVVLVPLAVPIDPAAVDLFRTNQPPTLQHLWGLDSLGRDVFIRTMVGGQVSLTVATGATILAVTIGAFVGALGAVVGGSWDRLIGRFVDFVLALPTIPLLIVLQSVTPGSVVTLTVVLGLTRWPDIARLVRAQCLSTLQAEFVVAARALGASRRDLLIRHLLPNSSTVLLVAATVAFGTALLTESTLSFLGVGLSPDQPSWGTMLNGAQESVLAGGWWAAFFPGAAIALTIGTVNALTDRLQRVLNPQSTYRSIVSRDHWEES